MTSKDEALTYEELTNLCRKQEEYIKELEMAVKNLKKEINRLETNEQNLKNLDTEKSCMPSKPTYEELEHDIEKLTNQVRNNDKLIFALEKSLVKINDEAMNYKREAEWYQQQTYELRKRLNEK